MYRDSRVGAGEGEASITRQERLPSLALVTISVYLKGLPVNEVNYKTTEINI